MNKKSKAKAKVKAPLKSYRPSTFLAFTGRVFIWKVFQDKESVIMKEL